MRILFISPNRLRLIVPPLPSGLASVAAAVKGRHEVRVLDFMFAEDPRADLRRLVSEFQPQVLALTLRNLDNQDSRDSVCYFPEVKDLISLLRGISPAPIIIGGAGFSIVPQALMDYLQADFGIVGEGEESFPAFLEAQETRNWAKVPGLVWRSGKKWVMNPLERIMDLAKLPPPALEHFTPRIYQDAEGSAKLPGMIPVQTRRGCPMQCVYCTTPLLEGSRTRGWPPEAVAAWLTRWHEQWGLTRFYFVDNLFSYPPEYARNLCLAIKNLRLPLEWGCLINPAFPDPELFRLIREAGCSMAQVGNESGAELVLSNLGKGFGREQVEETLRLLKEVDLPYSCFLMMGGPGETPDTVQESVALLEQFEPRLVNLTVGIRIYPGVALHRRAVAEGVVDPDDPLLWPKFYLSPAIRDWIWDYLEIVTARHPNWIF
ncbi:MAG: radical SAM protein [Deltaproteobacteria bacterium]|nr:radical SAM protein [Deltaproteobacteria bacterium]